MHEGLAYLQTANEQVACVVMIETEEGLRNVETIAATDGVDGLFVGPMDLCYGLGLAPGSFTDARFQQALGAILAACSKHDRAAGIFGYTPEMAAQSLQAGFDFVSAGTDGNFLRAGAAQALGVARGQGTAAAPSTPPDSGY
jgi:4-hydroxy-2-oxoheptanedioate aldolase